MLSIYSVSPDGLFFMNLKLKYFWRMKFDAILWLKPISRKNEFPFYYKKWLMLTDYSIFVQLITYNLYNKINFRFVAFILKSKISMQFVKIIWLFFIQNDKLKNAHNFKDSQQTFKNISRFCIMKFIHTLRVRRWRQTKKKELKGILFNNLQCFSLSQCLITKARWELLQSKLLFQGDDKIFAHILPCSKFFFKHI